MFKKLRNKLILINLGITSIVIVVVFTAIYMFATNSAQNRPPRVEVTMGNEKFGIESEDLAKAIDSMVASEKKAAAQDLLVMLIVSGVAIELVVVFLSYFLAEEAIKPIRETYETQKVFIANASHEIKTPLAAISANLEAADIQGNKWINNVEKETAKLTTLNNELLALARTDLVNEVRVEEVNLGQVTLEALKSFESRLGKVKLTTKIGLKKKIRLNVTDYRQILDILMDNAIKYSDKKIILELNDNELKVSNDGAKISKKDLPHIFERFYQTDKTTEGVGLGLSIAKSVAERNGWDLSADSSKMTEFSLKF